VGLGDILFLRRLVSAAGPVSTPLLTPLCETMFQGSSGRGWLKPRVRKTELAMRQEGACFFYQKRYYAAYQKIHEAG
jgi:hypothetical protein